MLDSDRAWVHLDFDVIIKMTDKAFLIRFSGIPGSHWIPFSQIEKKGLDYTEGDRNGSMCIAEWLCEEKGLV